MSHVYAVIIIYYDITVSYYLILCLCFSQFGSGRSSAPSVADSAAEYFDACDELVGVSSSEMSDESGLSDGSSNSEPDEAHG